MLQVKKDGQIPTALKKTLRSGGLEGVSEVRFV